MESSRTSIFIAEPGNGKTSEFNKLPILVMSGEDSIIPKSILREQMEIIIISNNGLTLESLVNRLPDIDIREIGEEEFKLRTEGHRMRSIEDFFPTTLMVTRIKEVEIKAIDQIKYLTTDLKNSHPFQKFMGKKLNGNKRRK